MSILHAGASARLALSWPWAKMPWQNGSAAKRCNYLIARRRMISGAQTHESREIFEETFDFENEIESLEPLLFILRRFIEQIALRLTLSSFAAEEIFLRLTLSQGSQYERAFKIPAPTTNVNVLFRVLFTHLENLKTEHPIKTLYLRANPCRPASEQFGLFDCVCATRIISTKPSPD